MFYTFSQRVRRRVTHVNVLLTMQIEDKQCRDRSSETTKENLSKTTHYSLAIKTHSSFAMTMIYHRYADVIFDRRNEHCGTNDKLYQDNFFR
jgi:hypothetical protein